MTDSDKPFACNMPGCGQTFTNNDRLVVHRQTHSLSLKIGKKGEDSITDQTPTPTRFLRNCDEEGLFEELGENVDNPFDRDFKTATSPHDKKHVETVVNTPVIAPLTPVCSASKNHEVVIVEGSNEKYGTLSIEHVSAPPAIQTVIIDGTVPSATDFLIQASQTGMQGTVAAGVKESIRSPKVSVVVSRNAGIPKAIPAFIAHPENPVPKATPAPQMISGIQLSIPTRAIVVSPTASTKSPSFLKSAKQKLKETIRWHQSQGNDVQNNMGNIINQAMDEAVSSYEKGSINNNLQEGQVETEGKKPAKRSRKSQEDLSPDEKREKFLERNRAAATRCREKRKIWIDALEKKAEEMSDVNSQLQNEISCLKHEVAQLKGLLLAHRDCPLSLTQQKMNPTLFDQLNTGGCPVIIDMSMDQQSAEAAATTALTQMAERATMEMGTISNGSS